MNNLRCECFDRILPKRLASILGMCFILYACATPIHQPMNSNAASANCSSPEGWDQIERHNPAFVVFGELHGTVEAPQMVARLVCALASRGERILLAVEHDASNNARLQDAWDLPERAFSAALLEVDFRDRQDGVASEAMFLLLAEAHSLKEQGSAIELVAFNGFSGEPQRESFANLGDIGAKEAASADNIARAASDNHFDRVLVLVGERHARTDFVEMAGERYEPMARRLQRSGKTVSLAMRYDNGTSWSCLLKPEIKPAPGVSITSDDVECGLHRAKGNAQFDRASFIEVFEPAGSPQTESYNGYFWLGPITGSPPISEVDS